MKRISTFLFRALFPILLLSTVSVDAEDLKGAKDHPLIKRFAGAEIIGYDYSKFDEYKLQTSSFNGAWDKTKEPPKSIEGAITRIWYVIRGDNSAAEVFRNYCNALLSAGFKFLWESDKDEWLAAGDNRKVLGMYYSMQNSVPHKFGMDPLWFNFGLNPSPPTKVTDHRKLTAQLSRPGGDTYATVYVTRYDQAQHGVPKGVLVALEVVDTGNLKQQMVTISASDMSKSISSTGRVALYGVYFDTNKSEVKRNSESALSEIAKLMRTEVNLKLYVVGHTDNVGGFASNMDLSKRRAQAVVDALVKKYSVAPTRLVANGVADLAPVASNMNEDGRALNRRVELVPQ